MKLLKKLGLGLLGLIVVLVVVSFLLPGKMHVERSLVMKAKAETTFEQVNTLKNWEKWSPWHQLDPQMQLTYEGPEAGVGAKYSWSSNHDQVGNGYLSIAESKPAKYIKTAMNFGEMGTAYAEYTFEPVAEGTKVTWSMETDTKDMPWQFYIPSKYMNLFMDDMIGQDFEKGLKSLKSIVESLPDLPAYEVTEKNIPDVQILSIKAVCSQEELPAVMGKLYGEIVAEMQQSKLEFAGHPTAIYHKYDPNAIEFEACIPVNKAGKTKGKIVAKEMKGGNVAMISHYGTYEKTYDAHMAMDKWLLDKQKTCKGSPWEVYITDPATEKDPAKWLTEIYYPI